MGSATIPQRFPRGFFRVSMGFQRFAEGFPRILQGFLNSFVSGFLSLSERLPEHVPRFPMVSFTVS